MSENDNVTLKHTIEEARVFARLGRVEEWVHSFLNSVGHNKPLSDGLKLQPRYWIGPILVEFKHLNRCCGPEPSMEFVIPVENWERDMKLFMVKLAKGWNPPPLIATNDNESLSVRDGNHRLEAMTRCGWERYWVIIWDSESEVYLHPWADSVE